MLDTLRFITCGSVDDGKSTLIGRLLWDARLVFEDHITALERDSYHWGTNGSAPDFALLLDGLEAEREQGITIDVAYRFFATSKRRFVVADTPGHEQFTRNMATGASTSDLALLVVNAENGLTLQTRRHARIASLIGIRHLAIIVNKMDLVRWDEGTFLQIVDQFGPLIEELKFQSVQTIPVSALHGDNVTLHSTRSSWYKGPALLPYLEEIALHTHATDLPFRMAVQYVNRVSSDYRGYCGRIACGCVRPGDRVRVVPGGQETKVKGIQLGKEELPKARTGDSVTLRFTDEIEVSRGTVISAATEPIGQCDQFEARLLSLSERDLIPGRTYVFRLHTCQATATITSLKHVIDINHGSHLAAKSLSLNDIGVANISTDRPVPFESYGRERSLGGFLLVDRHTNETVGAGMISFGLRRAENIHWQILKIDKSERSRQKFQSPACLWLTGLSGAGKSTIANLLEQELSAEGKHTYLLDGDNLRHGLNRDLGFTEADRVENIRRISEVAHLLVDAGLIVIVAFISPYRSERNSARSKFDSDEFFEIFVDAPLHVCEQRDPKGLYAKARRGELVNFSGIDSKYEVPDSPELRLDTANESPAECVKRILLMMANRLTGIHMPGSL